MKKLTIFVLATLIVACDKKNDDLLKKNDDLLKKIAIHSNIIIYTQDHLDTKQLVLFCQTENDYACSNYSIQTEQNFNKDNQLSIIFTNVIKPDLCATSIGPATTKINLSKLTNGQYDLELNVAGIKNNGILKISDSEIIIDFKNQNGIEIITPITKRVPVKTYWGSIGYSRVSSESSINQFIDKLSSIGAKFNKQSPGYYFNYEINDNGEMVIDAKKSGYYYAKGLIFQFDGDESKLKDLIQIDGKKYYTDNIDISLWSYKGEHFYNWGK
jgi:hypothetical protein